MVSHQGEKVMNKYTCKNSKTWEAIAWSGFEVILRCPLLFVLALASSLVIVHPFDLPVYMSGVIYTVSFNSNVLQDQWTSQVKRLTTHSKVQVSNGELQISTDGGCYTNKVTANIGDVSGRIRLAYEWESSASGWWEIPQTTVYEDGTEIWSKENPPCPDNQTIPDGDISGLDDQILNVDGTIKIEFAITPSTHCGADDHEWTEYRIQNLVVETAN